MMDGKTVARRSARIFETDESMSANENASPGESTATRRKPVPEEPKIDTNVSREHRHSRQSSTSACSEAAMEFKMDMLGSASSGIPLENATDGSGRTEKPATKEKMESRSALNFGNVIPDVYRSACPQPEDHDFLKSLGLKTILSLADKERPEEYGQFIRDNDIKHIIIDMEGTKKGIPFDTIKTILSVVLDNRNYPMLIHCNHGRHRTGCVVAVVRVVHGMHVDSVIEEYRHFSNPKPREVDIEYITTFSAATVNDVVYKARYGRINARQLPAQNPLLTMRAGQLVLGAALVLCIWGVTILKW